MRTRERTLLHIVRNPGQTPAEIHRAIGAGEVKNTYNAVDALFRGGHIRFESAGRKKLCYHRSIRK